SAVPQKPEHVMPSAFQRGDVWWIKFRDVAGIQRRQGTTCRTKTEAKRLAEDLERQAERQFHGLEPLPGDAASISFGELLHWWWETHGRHRADRLLPTMMDKHIRPGLAHLPVRSVTPAALEKWLHGREETLAPRSINYLRSLVHGVFSKAKS